MARPAFGSRTTCESCNSVDVRRRHREGRLRAGQSFSCSWTYGGEPSGTIHVRAEYDAVLLIYRARSWGATEWKSIEQRVPITWTACHLGGRRPWFVCSVCSNGRYCGRRVRSVVRCWRTICVPMLLRVGLREPARIGGPPRNWKGAEHPHEIGRECEHVRRFPG